MTKEDLTLRKMLEALKLINGTWPREKQYTVGPNFFYCKSNTSNVNYAALALIKKLGFEDVEMTAQDSFFNFKFIWKVEKE